MTTPAQLTALIEAKIQDAKPYINVYGSRGLSSEDLITRLLAIGVFELSRYSPLVKIVDFAGDASQAYPLVTKTSNAWFESFSIMAYIRYPLDATDPNQEHLDEDTWRVEKTLVGSAAVDTLIFEDDTPAVAEDIRVHFSAPHDVISSPISVYDQDLDAFANLIAGWYITGSISTEFLQHIDRTITADLVANSSPPPTEIKQQGENLISLFYKHFGVSDPENPSPIASAWVQWSSQKSRGDFYHR
jgi:hypothetical protein